MTLLPDFHLVRSSHDKEICSFAIARCTLCHLAQLNNHASMDLDHNVVIKSNTASNSSLNCIFTRHKEVVGFS
jgi:hypothetical protein